MVRGLILAGILVLILAIGIWVPGTESALPLMIGLGMLGVLAILLGRAVAESMKLAYRPHRTPAAIDPPQSVFRGFLRTLAAGPVSLLLAVGLSLPIGMYAPLPAADRLIIGGLMAPIFWAILALWAQGTYRPLVWTLVGLVLGALATLTAWFSLS